jgi:hypothetical protein
MQLCTAALQLGSSVAPQLVAAREEAPQLADALLHDLKATAGHAQLMDLELIGALGRAMPLYLTAQQQQRSQGGALQQRQQQHQQQQHQQWLLLLQSPHVLRLTATMVVLTACCVRVRLSETHKAHTSSRRSSRASGGSSRGSGGSGGSNNSNSSSSRGGSTRGSRTGAQSNTAAVAAAASNEETASIAFTACELQLLQLLGLSPELLTWPQDISLSYAVVELRYAVSVCGQWYSATSALLEQYPNVPGQQEHQQQQQQWQQRWLFERQLWLLLPTALLPFAHALLSTTTSQLHSDPSQQQQTWEAVLELLKLNDGALHIFGQLHGLRDSLNLPMECALLSPAWVQEALCGMLQVAQQLLVQQEPVEQPEAAAAAAAMAGPSATAVPGGDASTPSSNSSTPVAAAADRAKCMAALVLSLCPMVDWLGRMHDPYSCGRTDSVAAAAAVQFAEQFVEVGAAVEAGVRIVMAAVLSGTISCDHACSVGVCADVMLARGDNEADGSSCAFVRHMGLHGPTALAQERRQLYSLLSTLLKFGRMVKSAGSESYAGEQVAGSSCLAAAHAAVRLLEMASAESAAPPDQHAQSAAAAAVAVAAAALQTSADNLPSLVIFGRCCLQWADILASGAWQGRPMHEHGAALVCIPRLREGAPFIIGTTLEGLVGMVLRSVGCVDSPSAQAQLAAAGCAPQQLQEQLESLLSAQQGMQQGLNAAPLTALVQQLRGTGGMLTSIAVPSFCNNPACGNVSGPTEVQLVSGRSCMCAGCRIARYCGRACQRAAWQQHKQVCKALAAAATKG